MNRVYLQGFIGLSEEIARIKAHQNYCDLHVDQRGSKVFFASAEYNPKRIRVCLDENDHVIKVDVG